MSRRSKNKTTARTRRARTGTNALARIDLLTKNAPNLWFGMLATLVFASITLFGLQDIDFFGIDRETKLPLIGVTVPVMYFFAAGAALTTAIYIYFHLYLLQLWEELGRIPPRPKGRSLNKAVHPWLVTDTMIRWRSRMRGDNCAHPRALTGISSLSTIALAWLFGPAVLAYFWWRSMPAHDEGLTLLLGVFFLLAIYTLLKSALTARHELGQKPNARLKWAQRGLTILLIVAILPLSWLRTEGGFEYYAVLYSNWRAKGLGETGQERDARIKAAIDAVLTTQEIADAVPSLGLSAANLRGAHLTQLPADWRPRAHARKWFFAEWCKREALQGKCEEITEAQIADRLEEWKVHRQTYLDRLVRPNLRGRDLRGADLANAFLPNVDLRNAILDGANLEHANLEGAKLEGVRAEYVNLSYSFLGGASLRGASFQGADFRFSHLESADLSKGNFYGVDFRAAFMWDTSIHEAQFIGVNLTIPRTVTNTFFGEANLSGSLLVGYKRSRFPFYGFVLPWNDFSLAALKNVDLRGGVGFEEDQIETMFGDASVFPPDYFPEAPCHWAREVLETDIGTGFNGGDSSDWGFPFPPNDPFIGRWRGWVEANGGAWPTSPLFAKFKDVIAIPPPPECPLIKDM